MPKENILILRSEEDSINICKAVSILGCNPIILPQFKIIYKDIKIDFNQYEAIIATSANAIRFIKHPINLPIFVVGDNSARIAQSIGFEKIYNAKGDGEGLSHLIAKIGIDNLLYLAGEEVAFDLVGTLSMLNIDKNICYHLEFIENNIDLSGINFIMFHSAKTAEFFLHNHNNQDFSHITAICISNRVRSHLVNTIFRRIGVASRPNDAEMLAMFKNYLM